MTFLLLLNFRNVYCCHYLNVKQKNVYTQVNCTILYFFAELKLLGILSFISSFAVNSTQPAEANDKTTPRKKNVPQYLQNKRLTA